MKDISIPNYTSAKIIVRILEGKIDFEQIRKAAQYEEMVKPQLEALIHLKNSLDNDFNLYSFMSQMYPSGMNFLDRLSGHFRSRFP